jgi:pimeloyl-ACP methyl ester carboxylesterase
MPGEGCETQPCAAASNSKARRCPTRSVPSRRTRWRWLSAAAYAIALVGSSVVRGTAAAPPIPAGVHLLTLNAVGGRGRASHSVRLAYREYRGSGEGTPVLLLHGSPGSSTMFEGLAPLLAPHRMVLVPDLPGFGFSSAKIPDYSFLAHAHYVHDLLEARGLDRVHVVGFSMGGGVALSLANLDPNRLESLTMVSAIGMQEMELLGDYHINHAIHGVQLASVWALSHAVPHTGRFDATLSYARNFFDSDQRPLERVLRQIRAPTLFVHGRLDPLVPVEAAIEHARLVPQSELQIIDDDHFMVWEHPERIAVAVNAFLSRVDDRQAASRQQADTLRIAASRPPFDPRVVPRARAVTAAVLGTTLIAASACAPGIGPVGAGVIAAQGRWGYAWTVLCCALGAVVASARRRSIVNGVHSAVIAAGRAVIGIVAGTAVLSTSFLAESGAWTRALTVTALVGVFLWLTTLVVSYRRRRLLLSSWLRLSHWEYWPPCIAYVPVAVYILRLMWRHRSVTAFTAVNPAMPAGGFIGESKIEILRGLSASSEWVAQSAFIDGNLDIHAKVTSARLFMQSAGLDLPIVLKPDHGQRGSGVVVARTWDELTAYLEQSRVDTVIQEYVPGLEFGVFYCRRPSEPRGRVLSITEKQLPAVTGDGRSTLERLILQDRRTLGMARFHLARQGAALDRVPVAEQRVSLGDCGSHCRGATFLDGRTLLTPALERAFDRIACAYDGFYFGRFDVRVSSKEAFAEGRGFRIIELNGVTSEPTHIYDPKVSALDAYGALFEQWRLAFEIGAENAAKSATKSSIMQLLRSSLAYREESKGHVVAVTDSSAQRVN